MKSLKLVFTLAFFFGSFSALQAQIVKVVVDDTINPITAEYIERAIDHADQERANAVLVELHTPGGLGTSMEQIISKILAAKTPVIVFVTPSGGEAASAGFFILESADIAAMSPGTNTGASHPVFFSPTGGGEIHVSDEMKKKVENNAAAFLRSFAGKRGRNVEVAETAVRESKSWTDEEALNQKLIDVIAKDDSDLFRQLDGRTITRFNGETMTLHVAGKPSQPYPMTLKEHVLGFLMDPNIAFILFAVGALAIYAEFNHPGAVVPGVVGTVCVLLALFALNLLPTNYAAFVLILGAFLLFAADAKFQTHGVATIGGIVLMIIGALLLVDGPIPEMRVKLITALSVCIPLGLISAFLVSIAMKARRAKVVTGPQGLIGEIAVARSPLIPRGKVMVKGELWDAVSSEPVETGDSVEVRAVKDLTLEVQPKK
jgi:membrane-bound serine protease (ClpP class)